MDGAEKLLIWLIGVTAVVVISCSIVDTYEKSVMAAKGYEQVFEPVTKHKYWVKIQ
jgi:hypothetical protein